MINFDEEIKKFHPSLEIEEAEDAIYNNNISDITDVMIQMINELKSEEYLPTVTTVVIVVWMLVYTKE